MSKYLSNQLAECFLKNGLITENEVNNYRYYTQLFIEKMIGFSLILLVALNNHFLVQTIFFLLNFSHIRKYSGGFHTKNFVECIILSLIVYLGYVRLLFPFLLQTSWFNICLLVWAFIIILTIGAVNHPNMHWDMEEYIMCKNTTRMICIVEVGIIIAFLIIGIPDSYILFMSFGIILSAIMLLIAKLIKQVID